MLNYLRLHFNFLFSRIFIICYLLIIVIITLGIYTAASLDLGYSYLDGNRYNYYQEYLLESLLIIEVLVIITTIFVGTILSSKANEFLICFCVTCYRQKVYFLLARIFVGIIVSLLTVIISGLTFVFIGHYLTPYNLDFEVLIKVLALVFYQALVYQMIVYLIISIINHFLVIVMPLMIFWYQKTIYSFQELENSLQETILDIIPSYIFQEGKLLIYKSWELYLVGMLIFGLNALIINTLKDCR